MSSPRQHTPGPWQVFTANNFTTIQGAVEDHPIRPGRATVAAIGWTKAQSALSNWESNARLIAAAPELLAELANQVNRWQAMLEHAERYDDTGMAYSCRNAIHNARAAIAKAKGGAE